MIAWKYQMWALNKRLPCSLPNEEGSPRGAFSHAEVFALVTP